jgi:catechol 2,3-dioxygenase-like lactoylglutathione lyase family enzyme
MIRRGFAYGRRLRGVDSPVKGFSHVQLRVTDVARSVEWYRTAVGLTAPHGELGGAVPMFTPNMRAAVVISAGYAGAGDVDHLAFGASDREALAAWGEQLTAAGIEHAGLVESNEGISLHLVDPDGLNVELIAPKG